MLLTGGAVVCVIRWQAWFGMPDEPVWNGERQEYVMPPYLATAQKDTLSFLVLGDIHSRLSQAQYDSLAVHVPDADAIIQVGDWMERGQGYYYQLLLREYTESALCGKPVIAVPGNHEYSKGPVKRVSPVWENAFPHPHNGPVEVPGCSYFLDTDAARFIIIDTNPLDRLVYLTRTLTWYRYLQQSAEGRFVIVLMHHPVLSVGKGRFSPLIYSTFRHALGEADLVIAGHDHSYMRRTPFVILNTAGKEKEQKPLYMPEVTETAAVYGKLRIEHSAFSWKVYRLDDHSLVDSLYVKHD